MASLEIEKANPLVGLKTIDENGNIHGLDAFKGESVFVIRAPKIPDHLPGKERAQKAIETPKALATELLSFARAHRELTLAQYRQFTEKYGTPADLMKEYTKRVAPEDVQVKVKELNTLLQSRLDEAAKEMNTRYEKIEQEFDAAVERLFKAKDSFQATATASANANGHAEAHVNGNGAAGEAHVEPGTDATPRKAARKTPRDSPVA